jgi:hypothetical protein
VVQISAPPELLASLNSFAVAIRRFAVKSMIRLADRFFVALRDT